MEELLRITFPDGSSSFTFGPKDDELTRELITSGHYPRREFRVDPSDGNLWLGPHCRVDLLLCIARASDPLKSADARLGQAFSMAPFYDPSSDEVRHLDGDPANLRAANLVAPPAPVFTQLGPRYGPNIKRGPAAKPGADWVVRSALIKEWLRSKIY